ncbi:cell wall integrity and stress response component 3-like [Haliotis rubra]|uniref:cell wall integrity and stress response component 3-like n=1 Tax=Haliotis rubra TaxID=36100 RepID=UPI001EE5E7AA|nr:cell wall integrity and stress response component 3-like [Haliotis rubra]
MTSKTSRPTATNPLHRSTTSGTPMRPQTSSRTATSPQHSSATSGEPSPTTQSSGTPMSPQTSSRTPTSIQPGRTTSRGSSTSIVSTSPGAGESVSPSRPSPSASTSGTAGESTHSVHHTQSSSEHSTSTKAPTRNPTTGETVTVYVKVSYKKIIIPDLKSTLQSDIASRLQNVNPSSIQIFISLKQLYDSAGEEITEVTMRLTSPPASTFSVSKDYLEHSMPYNVYKGSVEELRMSKPEPKSATPVGLIVGIVVGVLVVVVVVAAFIWYRRRTPFEAPVSQWWRSTNSATAPALWIWMSNRMLRFRIQHTGNMM